jgi:hypothetical protein
MTAIMNKAFRDEKALWEFVNALNYLQLQAIFGMRMPELFLF